MTEVQPRFKAPREKRAKGRARPDDPLAVYCVLGCGNRAVERHHIIPRGPGSSDAPEATMDLCYACHHVRIHGNPSWAYSMGYLKRRGN